MLPINIKTYKIYKYVHNSSKVPNDSCWCKKQAICHYLQIKLNAHEYYKNIFSNLKIKAENSQFRKRQWKNQGDSVSLNVKQFSDSTWSVGACITLLKGDSNIMEMQEQIVTMIMTQSR